MTERKKYEWLTENSRLFLSRGYLLEGVTPEQRIREIAEIAQDKLGIDGFADKFENYMSKGWYSLSTPVWTNFGNNRGLPISCFGSHVNDNMADILKTAGEVGMMSKYGGGTSGYFGDLRPRGAEITNNGHSSGAVHFVKLFEQITDTVSQGCYDDETEVLTDKGFLPFETVIKDKSIKVAQVTDEDEIEFVKPLDYMKFIPEDNELLLFKDTKNINLLVTKNHNMVFKRDGRKMVNGVKTRYLKPEYKTAEAEFAPLHRDIHYAHGSLLPSKGRDSGLTDLERLYIAIQADGTLVRTSKEEQNAIRFRFIKKRKSDRVEELLNNLEIKYSISQYTETDNSYNIYFNLGYKAPKLLEEWVTLEDKSLEWAEDFIDEVSFWDGSIRNEEYSSFNYSSTIKSNVDIIQAIASMCGYKSYMVKDLRENEPNKSTIYKINVAPRSRYFGVGKLKTMPTEYNGYVYCVEVPSHKLIVRRGGRTLVCGNSSRRGRFAPYLPIDHPDIEEFLEIGTEGNEIQDVNHAVTVTDSWILEMIGGDSDKRKTWAKVLQRRVEMGYPYIFFTDTVNNNKPEWYKDKPITHSNLCVSGDTQILTDKGYVEIESVVGTKQNVWNGEEWSNVDIIKTGENQHMLHIETDSGYELTSTPYHKFYILDIDENGKPYRNLRTIEVRAQDLKVGDKLIKFDLPVIEGDKELSYAYDNGFYSGDGTTYKSGRARLDLYGDKKQIQEFLSSVDNWNEITISDADTKISGSTNKLKPKFFVPNAEYTIESRLNWLSGYLDADGTVTNNNGSQSLQIASINKEFLQNIQLMLQTLGVDSKVAINKEKGTTMLPLNDGSGQYGEFETKAIYRILINGNSLYKLHQLGLKCHRLQWEEKKPNREATRFIQIKSISELDELYDTYCFTEPKRHMGMFNGILTGQCSEIALPDNENWSFVCNLSSMNVLHFDEWKDTDAVETMIYFLDAVMSDFIEKLERLRDSEDREDFEAFMFMEKAYNFALENRALGLGILGLHSLYQSRMIPFESTEASLLNEKIFKTIREQAEEATKELAKIFGEPEIMKGTGRRNSTLMSVAPTTSSAFILGQVSQSIEPLWSNNYVKDVAKAKVTVQNPYLKKVLEKYGKDTRETWIDIRNHDGSVQHLDYLTEHEKDVFKTFSEINQYEVLNQASIRQKYIDQGQSLNIMVNPKATAKELNELHLYAWENGIKTLYYQHSTNAAQKFYQTSVCLACEA